MACRSTLAVLLLVISCTSDDDGDSDAAVDSATSMCSSDDDCDDANFCNGEETCDPDHDDADASGCVNGDEACPDAECNESTDECSEECPDADGDGSRDVACGGGDCDDADPNRYPGNAEVCDPEDHDEDCDDATFGVRDADGDDSPDAMCCNGENCGLDCDDTRASVNPRNVETCDGLDNDCDGTIDEEVILTFYEDGDGDDFGSSDASAMTMTGCSPPPGYADNQTDCDDTMGGINPGVPERCDGTVDEDCDGNIDEGCTCTVPSTRDCDQMGVCAAGQQTCVDGMWSACSITGSTEICNQVDDDCDGSTDETLTVPCWEDPDEDGYAVVGAVMTMRCTCQNDETEREPVDADIDCREDDPDTYPGATELCDGIDNDCSSGGGAVSAEDRDGDGYTDRSYGGCNGGPFPRDDCNDSRMNVNPGITDYPTEPFCTSGRLCSCGGTLRCIQSMLPICGACMETSGSAPTWDYDCSGSVETPPPFSGCSGNGCTTACRPRPSGSGPVGSVNASQCGTTVSYGTCGGGVCVCAPGSANRTLGCH